MQLHSNCGAFTQQNGILYTFFFARQRPMTKCACLWHVRSPNPSIKAPDSIQFVSAELYSSITTTTLGCHMNVHQCYASFDIYHLFLMHPAPFDTHCTLYTIYRHSKKNHFHFTEKLYAIFCQTKKNMEHYLALRHKRYFTFIFKKSWSSTKGGNITSKCDVSSSIRF